MNTFILKNHATNKYVAIDNNSGGYPYETEWYNAQIFTDFEYAKRYAKTFGFYVCTIRAEINGVMQQ